MDCEHATQLLSARLDGELTAADAASLEAHLASCAECSAMAEGLAIDHAQLVRGFALHRRAAADVAERVATEFPARPARPGWLVPMLAAAAGFFLASLIFHGELRPQPVITTRVGPETQLAPPQVVFPDTAPAPAGPPPVAQLALATGKVEILPPGASTWRAMETGGAVPAGAHIRTGNHVRCEFQIADGSDLRVDERTELRFVAARQLDLSDGQVMAGVAKDPVSFSVSFAQATASALGTRFDVSTRSGRTSVSVFEGMTRVALRGASVVVHERQELRMEGGALGEPREVWDLELAARWADELLVLKGHDNPALGARVNELLAQIGRTKAENLYESEIRALGDHCVLPLTRYIQSDAPADPAEKRRMAARIAADCAQPWCVPYLIELLRDRDGDVRAAAAHGLHRLTGEQFGEAADWQQRDERPRAELVRQWQEWWQSNKDHIPGPPADVDAPARQPTTAAVKA